MSVVKIRSDGAVLRLTLDRPEKLNALSADVLAELTRAVHALEDDLSVRVVVLSGAGRAFSAGADLSGGAIARQGADATWTERRRAFGGWQRLLDRFEDLGQVTVGALHGHCIGGAALLATACDIRVADTTLQVRIPELAIGIPLTWGGNPRLAREIGLPLMRDLVMTGRVMEADEALHCGFVQRLVQEGELEEATEALVGELLAMPDGPLRMTKSMTAAMSRTAIGTTAWADADLLAWSGREQESRDAAIKYAERRANRKGPSAR